MKRYTHGKSGAITMGKRIQEVSKRRMPFKALLKNYWLSTQGEFHECIDY